MGLLTKKKGAGYEAFEPSLHAFRMTFKMHKYFFYASLFLHLFIIVVYLVQTTTQFEIFLFKTQGLIWASSISTERFINPIVLVLDPYSAQLFESYLSTLKKNYSLQQATTEAISIYFATQLSKYPIALLAFLLWPLSVFLFNRKAKKQRSEKHIRGADELIPEKRFIKLTKKGDLPIGKAKLPIDNEVTHLLVIGAAGKGKTVQFMDLLQRLLERKEQIIIHDFKGDFTQKFYNAEQDLILNPLDARSLKWNLFSMIPKNNILAASLVVEQLVAVIIPAPSGQSDPFWSTASRQVLGAIILVLLETGRATNEDLWAAICLEEKGLVELLRLTSSGKEGASKFGSKGGSNQALGIMSTISTNASFLKYMPSGDFDIDAWLEKGKGALFLLNNPQVKSAIKPILTLFLDVIARKILAEADSQEKRTFFLLDELGQLGKTSSIKDLVTLGRSKGAAMLLGIQDFSQLDKIYGRDARTSIINSISNTMIFGLNDPDTSKYFADKIGKHEIMDMHDSMSMGPSDYKDGMTISHQRKELYLVRPDELMALPPLKAIVSIDKVGASKLSLTIEDRESKNEPFQFLAEAKEVMKEALQEEANKTEPAPAHATVVEAQEDEQEQVDDLAPKQNESERTFSQKMMERHGTS